MNVIKPCILFLLKLSVVVVGYGQSIDDKYQEILDKAHINGVPAIVALVQSSDNKEWKGKAGVSNIEDSTPLSIDQSFRLASITKVFTSLVILQLVDEKKIALSDTISKYLDVALLNKISNADNITIFQLLSHSSGIYSFSENNNFWKECFFNNGLSRVWTPAELISYVENKKPANQPSEPFIEKFYSNTNYILLGMIIEKVMNNSLSDEYQTRIFTPLGMNHTFLEGYDIQNRIPIHSYAIPNSYFLKSAMKKRGIEEIDGTELINLSQEYILFNSWAWAAGGISSNINDLSSFLSVLRSGELLTSESQKVLEKLYSSEDKGITFFGGTGGSDGIQATMLYIMPEDIVIIILINSSGLKEINLGSVFVELYKVAIN